MSDLYPVIQDIISALNSRYGADISAERIFNAYTPEYDEGKEEFTDKDIQWLLQKMKSHSFSGGVRGLVKLMGDKFNNDLKQTILDASRVHGDLPGVVKFLINYDKLKDKLQKGKTPSPSSRSNRLDLKEPIQKVKNYLKKIKEDYTNKYEGSFYEYTDQVLSILDKYIKSSEKSPKFERELMSIFVGEDDNPGLVKGWRRLNVKGVSDSIKKIYNTFADYTEKEEISKKDIINPPKEGPLSPLEKKVRNLGNNFKELDTDELEINKDMKGEKRKEIREETKDVGTEDKYKYALNNVKEYLKKAKSSYPEQFDKYSLHKYTADLVNVLEEYYSSEGRDVGTNKKISDIFNEDPGIISMWEDLNKTFAQYLRQLKSSFASLVRTKKDAPHSIDNSILNKLENLHGRTNLNISEKDELISKGLSNKKDKKYPDSGKELDPIFYNKLIKEVIKHKSDLPKKPGEEDLAKLDLSKEELEKAKQKEYLDIVSKTLNMADKIEEDKDLSSEELASKIIQKFKEEAAKNKEKQEKDKDLVMDRKIKEDQEDKKPSPKESSTNIISNYKGTLFYKLEKLAAMSQDKLVKAELIKIAQEIKHIL